MQVAMLRITALVLSIACGVLAACVSSTPAPVERWPDDRAEMVAALAASAESWNRGDLKGHLAIYDSTVTAMTKSGPRPGVAAIEASFEQAYFRNGQPKQALRMEQVSVRSLAPGSALMTGRFVLFGGGLPEQSGWFTLVWVHTAAGWKVVHDHSS